MSSGEFDLNIVQQKVAFYSYRELFINKYEEQSLHIAHAH